MILNFLLMAPLILQFADCQSAIISLSKVQIMEGESVNITCLTEIPDQDLNPVTVILKHTFNSEEQRTVQSFPDVLPRSSIMEDTSSVEISTNHFLNEDIFDNKKYQCSYHLVIPGDYSRIEYRLRIDNASTEDFGYYSCRMSFGNQTVESDARLLQIISAVVQVRWSEYDASANTWHQLKPNETLNTREDKLLMIRCEAEGGFPKPSYSVVIREVDGSDRPLDITSHFHEQVTCPLDKGPKGLQKLQLRTMLMPMDELESSEFDKEEEEEDLKGLKISSSFHEKNVVCSAEVAHIHDDAIRIQEAEIFIELTEFRPKFECENKILVEANVQNFSIMCLIKARPGIKRLNIFHNGSMPVEQKNGEYMADTEVINGTNEEHVRSTLTIYRVSWKHFGKYEFIAINDAGNSTHTIELIKENKNQKTLSQKSITSSSISINSRFEIVIAVVSIRAILIAGSKIY